MIPALAPAPPYVIPTRMIDVIAHLGLSANLKLCLDAGDAASYTSGQSWLDLSGGGYDFLLGETSSASGDDPTFNGVAGRQSIGDYFSFDGGDCFVYDSANETWMENLHKNNAAFSIAAWVYAIIDGVGTLTDQALFSTFVSSSSGTGCRAYYVRNSGSINFACRNAGGLVLGVGTTASGPYLNGSQWNFVGISLDEASGTISFQVNDEALSGSASYSAPSSGSASNRMYIGLTGPSGTNIFLNGTRLAKHAMWSSAIGASALDQLFQATRGVYGV